MAARGRGGGLGDECDRLERLPGPASGHGGSGDRGDIPAVGEALGSAEIDFEHAFRIGLLVADTHLAEVVVSHAVEILAVAREMKADQFRAWLDEWARRRRLDDGAERDEALHRTGSCAPASPTTGWSRAGSGSIPSTGGGPCPWVGALIDYDDLAGQLAATGRCQLDDGTPLSAVAVRRLACEAEIIPITLGGNGMPLDVGRKYRTATWAQRRRPPSPLRHLRLARLRPTLRLVRDPPPRALAARRAHRPR